MEHINKLLRIFVQAAEVVKPGGGDEVCLLPRLWSVKD